MATIHGIDPIAAGRLAYDHIRCLGDPAYDDLPIDAKIELMDLGLNDPTICDAARTRLTIDLLIDTPHS